MEDTLIIGVITKPQGVRGELKVNPITSDVNRFNSLKNVIIDGVKYSAKGKACNDYAIISISGVNDRNTAETFRGKFLRVNREDAISLKENEYFIADLIGATLKTEKGVIGKITDVTSQKTDVITVSTTDNKVMRFPFLKDSIIEIDVIDAVVTLKEQRLKEIAVYED